MYRRILFEEGLLKELLVVGVKLVAVVLVLWCCLQILPEMAKESATHLLATTPTPYQTQEEPRSRPDPSIRFIIAFAPYIPSREIGLLEVG